MKDSVKRLADAAGGILPAGAGYGPQAQKLAAELGLAVLGAEPPEGLFLTLDEGGLALKDGRGGHCLRVDFLSGPLRYRMAHPGREALARAVGCRGGARPTVLDATAGLGRDAFTLAALGCRVILVERSPVVAALLADGMARARRDPALAPVMERMELWAGAAEEWLDRCAPQDRPEVVYLDPMFPTRQKMALVKGELRMLQRLLGMAEDGAALLAPALRTARKRVVVKRPRHAPSLGGRPPDFSLEGRSIRFDVYVPGESAGQEAG